MKNKYIIEEILNATFLKLLYPEGINFKNCFVNELIFSYEGPSVFISFHIDDLPNEIPKKWINDFNKIKIILEFIEISKIDFNSWGTINKVKVDFSLNKDDKTISVSGKDCKFKFKFKWMNFKSISPYMNDEK